MHIKKTRILNGREYTLTFGDKWVATEKLNKEKKIMVKTSTNKLKSDDKQTIANGIIKSLKENHSDLTVADRCKILANAYTVCLKEKKGVA